MNRILKGILNINQVASGWKKHWLKEPLTKEEKRKIKICSDCENLKNDEWFDLVNEEVTECRGKKCNLCDCPILIMVRTNKKCQIKKF